MAGVVAALKATDRMVESIRRVVSRLFDDFQRELRYRETRWDPEARAWASQVRESVKDGSIWTEFDTQPSVNEILEQYRSAAT